jgi:host factor-I protein
MVNRKLVRPNLAEIKEKMGNGDTTYSSGLRPRPSKERESSGSRGPRGRPAPPELTNAEAFYYLKQMNSKTPMVVVMDNGEALHGHIEWYDRSCLKMHREDDPNILIFKNSIRYLHKMEDESDA